MSRPVRATLKLVVVAVAVECITINHPETAALVAAVADAGI